MDPTDHSQPITDRLRISPGPSHRQLKRRPLLMEDRYSLPLIVWPLVHHSLAGLLDSGEFSDYTIRCRGRNFQVHRSIISAQSRFFEAACKHTWREGSSRVLDLPDDDPEAVGAVVQFIYHGVYTDPLLLESKYRRTKCQLEVRGTMAQGPVPSFPSISLDLMKRSLSQPSQHSRWLYLQALPYRTSQRLRDEEGDEE